mgnify:CR=1 FL=1
MNPDECVQVKGGVYKKGEPVFVYLAVLHDRHCDDVIKCFYAEQDARQACADWLHTEQEHRSWDIGVTERVFDGYVYYASYGESDCVYVQRLEVG